MSDIIKEFKHLKIELGAIQSATNNFGDRNYIGRGGFGKVYKGELLQSNRNTACTVAVKCLDRRYGQGDTEFWKEVMTLSLYKHENIVNLLGFCDDNGERMLVYEYVSKKSLDLYLSCVDLTWIQRLNICLGAARGLEYLHDPKGTQQRILHRDIKSSNVLLDENWIPKISDFGLSKIGPANRQFSIIVTDPVGTMGYVDPLCVEKRILTKESDVYSFGVVLFEVLCGRLCHANYNDESPSSFVEFARHSFEQNKLNEIVYDRIKIDINPDSLKAFATIAYKCLKRAREERPTMTQIVKELEIALEFQREAAIRYDLGKLQFGCKHYRSRCKLRAPCCNQIFPCRRCHDEYTSQFNDPKERHKMVSKDVIHVVCTICHTEQQAAQICGNCGAKMGEYFCRICKLYDDDTSKQQFHCDDCGICRLGGRENYFHCPKCGGCYHVIGRGSHPCLEDALRIVCNVCLEDHFDAVKKTKIMMPCGHAIHEDCHPEILSSNRCIVCSNSIENNIAKVKVEGS